MLDKRTFKDIINTLSYFTSGMEELEETLKVTFDNNFMTHTLDSILDTVGKSFFRDDQLEDLENQPMIETVIDIIYHYAFRGEFGLKTGELQRLYVEDEGLKTEEAFNAFNAEELYDIIVRYLQPPRVCKTYTIHC